MDVQAARMLVEWRKAKDPRKYFVSPIGDAMLVFDDCWCVIDDFGNLVRVPS